MGLNNFPVVTGIGFRPWQVLKCKSHLVKHVQSLLALEFPYVYLCLWHNNKKPIPQHPAIPPIPFVFWDHGTMISSLRTIPPNKWRCRKRRLVGDFNPTEKYYLVKLDDFPKIGMKITNSLKPPPRFFVGLWVMVWSYSTPRARSPDLKMFWFWTWWHGLVLVLPHASIWRGLESIYIYRCFFYSKHFHFFLVCQS